MHEHIPAGAPGILYLQLQKEGCEKQEIRGWLAIEGLLKKCCENKSVCAADRESERTVDVIFWFTYFYFHKVYISKF